MQDHLRTDLVLDALDMAAARRQPDQVIHNSDQAVRNWFNVQAIYELCRKRRR